MNVIKTDKGEIVQKNIKMNIKMKCYGILTRLFRGHNLDRYPFIKRLHIHIVNKATGKYINFNGYKMIAGVQGWIHFQYTGVYEPITTKLILDIIKPGDVVVDAGANVGYYTLLFSRLVGNSGKVYAFEPDPINFSRLLKNIELNGCKNIVAERKALSDINGVVKLFLHELNPGGHTITDAYENLKFINVDCITLQDYFKDKKCKLSFIKADVEGAEDRVLRGSGSLIDGKVGLLLEFNYDIMSANHSDGQQLIDMLKGRGYGMIGINEKAKLIVDIIESKRGVTLNVLCHRVI